MWKSTQFGMMHFLGVRLQDPCAFEQVSGLRLAERSGNGKE